MGIGVAGMMAINAASQGTQMGIQESRAGKQQERQKELMKAQAQNQGGLMARGKKLQMEMWNETNYKAQMEKLKEAGLNPALMYGMSGGGGTTSGSSGGNASGGQASAPMQLPGTGMGIEAILMSKQMELMSKQIDDLESLISKRDGADTDNTIANTGNIEADTELKGANKLNVESQTALNNILGSAKSQDITESMARVDKLVQDQKLSQAQTDVVKQQLVVNEVKMQLDKANIKQTEQQTLESIERIEAMWEGKEIEWEKLDIDKKRNVINEFSAEIKAQYPGVSQVMGKNLNMWGNMLAWLTGNYGAITNTTIE